jgi:hypothetical protein
MSRKKSPRHQRPHPPQPTSPPNGNGPSAAVSTAAPATGPVRGSDLNQRKDRPARRKPPLEKTWLEIWGVRLARWLGSLQMAVLLLLVFAGVLAIGTMLESWYSAAPAQELVYRVWWFTLLLLLRAVNIFCAAVKKWPWKKHQTGFLITHLGLLTMLAGGVVTSLSNTDAVMTLVDTSASDVLNHDDFAAEFGVMNQSSNLIAYPDESLITVAELKPKPGSSTRMTIEREIEKDFNPGAISWKRQADQFGHHQVAGLLRVLNGLAHPLPRSWHLHFEDDQNDDIRLEVLAYYSHAQMDGKGNMAPDLEAVPGINKRGRRPVILCELSSTGKSRDTKEFWLFLEQSRKVEVGSGSNAKWFEVSYRPKQETVPFSLKLLRAEQTTDPGSESAATYTSWVQLTDKDKNINGQDCMITMNEPLDHRGYKVYQSNYQPIKLSPVGDRPVNRGRPVNVSGFTVGRDPGLWLKYLGSSMLALGIACMFYMKAYFFKPRGRRVAESLAEGTPPAPKEE